MLKNPFILFFLSLIQSSYQLEECPITENNSSNNSNNSKAHNNVTYRKDYQPLPYDIITTYLHFKLDEVESEVFSSLKIERKGATSNASNTTNADPLILDGSDHIKFQSGLLIPIDKSDGSENTDPIDLNEVACIDSTQHKLIIPSDVLPELFRLNITVKNSPKDNSQLFGLYKAEDLLITQNEANGFRRITYYFDRPDIFSYFTTTLEANKTKYPVLLSNGNMISSSEDGDIQTVTFLDPHPKPCYLFALVAGPLENISEEFTIGRPCFEALQVIHGYSSIEDSRRDPFLGSFCREYPERLAAQRKIKLAIWGKPGTTGRLKWALESIKKAILWDEIRYGRIYDLTEFHIVAVRDFNAGAMENKGLNIFNNALIIADQSISTDSQFIRVQGVIGHEYFHNWSGDRVSVRDWFQLTLKEGFTVFRDQQFTMDVMNSTAERLHDIAFMEDVQFAEDASPLKHPIRPDSFVSIENFYTTTVYEKGAEILRMYQTMLGWRKFREGADTFFRMNDHRGATCEDFKIALEKASGKDLSGFFLWYNTSGTPTVTVTGREWDPDSQTYALTLRQDSESPIPLTIPIRAALVNYDHPESPMDLAFERVLMLNVKEGRFYFRNVTARAIPSLLRDFSAPVQIKPFLDNDEILKLAAHDANSYIRWKSAQHIMTNAVIDELNNEPSKDQSFKDVEYLFRNLIQRSHDPHAKRDVVAMMLSVPSLTSMEKHLNPFNPQLVYDAIRSLRLRVLNIFGSELFDLFLSLRKEDATAETYRITPAQVGQRKLKNTILSLLAVNTSNSDVKNVVTETLLHSPIENDRVEALRIVSSWETSEEKLRLTNSYYDRNSNDDLIVDRWLAIQAGSPASDTYDRIQFLMSFPLYRESKTPNRLRALIRTFASNLIHFHHESGRGYELVANETLRWDSFNAKMGAGLATTFSKLSQKLPERNQELIKAQLIRIQSVDTISPNLREIVTRSLEAFEKRTKSLSSNTGDEL